MVQAAEDWAKGVEWRSEHAEMLELAKEGKPLPYDATIKQFSVSER